MRDSLWRSWRSVAVGLAVAVSAICCGGHGDESHGRVQVRLKWLHQAQFAGFYVAEQRGFYQREGIAAELHPGGVDFPAIRTVTSGAEQFGVTGADQILLARQAGAPVVAIAAIYRRSPFVYFSRKGSGISRVEDFRGRSIGVKLGGNEELTYRAMLKRAGVSSKEIKEIPIKYDMGPFFSGQVEAWPGYAINEPLIAREHGLDVVLIWPTTYGIDIYADVLFTTEAIIAKNPELVGRFTRATVEGWQWALQHPDEAASLGLLYSEDLNLPHERSMMRESISLVKPDEHPVGWMDSNGWSALERLLLQGGFLKGPVDVGRCFTTRFLEATGGVQ